MALLTDDQKMLQETAASFLAEEGAIAKQLRHWRDIGCKDGFGHGLWKQFAELGLTGICIPESHGGLGLGHIEAALVLEEIGRNLTPSPFLTTAVVGGAGDRGHRACASAGFPASCRARPSPALAIDEGRSHAPEQTALAAKRHGNGFVLTGAQAVRGPRRVGRHDRHRRAHRRTPGERDGITLFAVPQGRHGPRGRERRAGRQLEGGAADLRRCRARCRCGDRRGRRRLGAAVARRSTPAAPAPRPSWSASPPARRP